MNIDVFIEIPKGSRNKYEYDKERGIIRLDRMLFSSVQYPTDYGFIPETLSEDGDSLDALVLVWEPTFPGCLVTAKPVGIFHMKDEKGRDDKILCIPCRDPLWNHIQDIDDVQENLLQEIQNFFSIYKNLEKKHVEVFGWKGRKEAEGVIEAAKSRFRQ